MRPCFRPLHVPCGRGLTRTTYPAGPTFPGGRSSSSSPGPILPPRPPTQAPPPTCGALRDTCRAPQVRGRFERLCSRGPSRAARRPPPADHRPPTAPAEPARAASSHRPDLRCPARHVQGTAGQGDRARVATPGATTTPSLPCRTSNILSSHDRYPDLLPHRFPVPQPAARRALRDPARLHHHDRPGGRCAGPRGLRQVGPRAAPRLPRQTTGQRGRGRHAALRL